MLPISFFDWIRLVQSGFDMQQGDEGVRPLLDHKQRLFKAFREIVRAAVGLCAAWQTCLLLLVLALSREPPMAPLLFELGDPYRNIVF